jgi:hypothetical protein
MSNEKFTLVLDLQTFAEEPPADEPKEPEEPKEPPKTFTQEEIDRIVAERLSRQAKKFADYDDLKAQLAELQKAEEERKKAEMTAQERLEAEKAEALKRAQEAEEARERALTAANQRLIKSEFKLLAKESGIRADALEDAFKLADTSSITVDDDGNIVGAKDVVDALIASKPYLVEVKKEQPKQIGDPNSPPNDKAPQKTKEQLLKEAAEKARRTGRSEDLAYYSKLKVELEKS